MSDDIHQARYYAQAGSTGWYGNLILWFLSHGYWHICFLLCAILSYVTSWYWARQVQKMRKGQ